MIQTASDSGNAAALVFFLFDLLYLDGEDIGARRLIERKARLAALLSHASSPLHYSDHQRGQGRNPSTQATVLRSRFSVAPDDCRYHVTSKCNMEDTMSDNDSKQAKMLAAYGEVCRTYLAVDDFRAKLLALLPIVSGTGGVLLLGNKETVKTYLGVIGLFGILVTFGLFCYEIRGLHRCARVVSAGKKLENELQLTNGQFSSGLENRALGFVGATAAGVIVYLSVLLSWVYVAYVGFGAT
jgi:hypothetical protein